MLKSPENLGIIHFIGIGGIGMMVSQKFYINLDIMFKEVILIKVAIATD